MKNKDRKTVNRCRLKKEEMLEDLETASMMSIGMIYYMISFLDNHVAKSIKSDRFRKKSVRKFIKR